MKKYQLCHSYLPNLLHFVERAGGFVSLRIMNNVQNKHNE